MSELIRLEQKLDKNFKTICLEPIENTNLSWRAKGLHTYLISRPPGWKLWYTDLEQRSTDGKAAIGTAVKELQAAGYLKIDRLIGDKGRVIGSCWTVAQTPRLMPSDDSPHTDCPDTDSPDTVCPDTGNPLCSKKDLVLSNTDNKNETTTSDKPRKKMPKEDLTRLTEHFATTRGVRPVGKAWLPIQQGMRAMVVEEAYTVEQVIGCMDRLAANGWTWTMPTLRRWIADFAAGKMPSGNGSSATQGLKRGSAYYENARGRSSLAAGSEDAEETANFYQKKQDERREAQREKERKEAT